MPKNKLSSFLKNIPRKRKFLIFAGNFLNPFIPQKKNFTFVKVLRFFTQIDKINVWNRRHILILILSEFNSFMTETVII